MTTSQPTVGVVSRVAAALLGGWLFAWGFVTLGIMLSDTFAGIAPSSVPGFVAAELVGAVLALAISALLDGRPAARLRTQATPTRLTSDDDHV